MNVTRRLIVNADDFGLTDGINRGILESHVSGIVTSTSLMVRHGAATNAAALARSYPELSVGLHIDLGEWIFRDQEWTQIYRVVDDKDSDEVEREILNQLAQFRKLMGRNPSHLDSHQHVHRNEPIRSIALKIAQSLHVPLRGVVGDVEYIGGFYGQEEFGAPIPENLSPEYLIGIILSIPPGVSELGCHPGFADELESAYAMEREREIAALCDSSVRESIVSSGIELCSYDSLTFSG
jgi:predicted glycoside hydrolase/deacetylase ChbG (UPF0249 family)